MNIAFWSVGKKDNEVLASAIDLYTKRISHYFKVEWKYITAAQANVEKNKTAYVDVESKHIVQLLKPTDVLVLLDEQGKLLDNNALAAYFDKQMQTATKQLIFLIGGAYGVNDIVKKRAALVWSLSNLVFPHQIVRLLLAEQVYRTCTILKGEKYHHA